MLNYTFNREKAKTFVRYYKEKDDTIIVHYADGSNLQVKNSDDVKKNLNNIQEKQLSDYNESEYSNIKEIASSSFAVFVASFLAALIGTITIGGIGAIFGGFPFFLGTLKASTLLFIPTAYYVSEVVSKKINSRRFNLFLKYKKRINKHLYQQQEEVVNENTINKVSKPKKVKNLCINDINFMSYHQVKKLTNVIKKEERQAKLAKEKEELERIRYQALGIESGKQLIKSKKK